MNNIKWAAIQPLLGGAYLGAEEAIGHPAEWIMSFHGLTDLNYSKKTDELAGVGIEYNLLKYLEDHGRSVPYYTIQNGQFDIKIDDMNPMITLGDQVAIPDYEDIDLVIGVPVCSGLSMVTKASQETKDIKNGNMQWMANYVLSVIKPKIYIFENAPTLMGKRGDDLREWFNNLALGQGYSVIYYKTDTCLHNNCQKRPRTFVLFIKHNCECEMQNPPSLGFQDKNVSLVDFLKRIPEGCDQQIPVKTGIHNKYVLNYINNKYGDEWKKFITGPIMEWIIKNGTMDDLIQYVKDNVIDGDEEGQKKTLKYVEHIKFKKSQGLNYYGDDIQYVTTHVPGIQFRSMPNMLNPLTDQVYTIREYLSFMGMPYDFKLWGDESNMPKIGQNVPVGTAKFIVEQAMNIIINWNTPRANDHNVKYQNNILKTTEKL